MNAIDHAALTDAKLLEWMRGNRHAVEAVKTICAICDVWDDLIDKDVALTEQQVNEAFMRALVGLYANPFYREHQASFFPILVTGINSWLDANTLEKAAGEKERMLAFFIRTYIFEVSRLAAFLAGGWDHLRRVSMEMRMHFEDETYHDWEHRHGLAE